MATIVVGIIIVASAVICVFGTVERTTAQTENGGKSGDDVPAVVFSVIAGTAAGLGIHLGKQIN